MHPSLIERARSFFDEYPSQVWILVLGTLINASGAGLVFPFFSLYLTRQLHFSMTDVGVMFVLFAAMSVISQVVGGHLADQLGRKPVMVFSLLGNAAGVLLLGSSELITLEDFWLRWGWALLVIVIMGLTSGAYNPAVSAMVADLLESKKRIQAYGLLRVMFNLGAAIGPAIGGFVAQYSYLILFVAAAVATVIYVVMLAALTRETLPQVGRPEASAIESAPASSSFGLILQDYAFILFCLLIVVSQVVYAQMNTTLPVFLNQKHGISEQWYGLMMSLNAGMVVVFQFPITRRISAYDKSLMMALGNGFFAVGFGLFGFVAALPLFFLAQVIWTVGEMICAPVGQAFVADVAPESMRGRYMGLYGVSYAIGSGIGPLLGGLVMDGAGGEYIWYGAFILDGLALVAYLLLRQTFVRRAAQAA